MRRPRRDRRRSQRPFCYRDHSDLFGAAPLVSAGVSTNSPPERVLVVRLGAMGDVIHALAALTALRNASPTMRIGWVIEKRWAELLCSRNTPLSGPRSPQRPIVDFVHVVDTKRWRRSIFSRETRRQLGDALREVRDQ